MRIDELALTRYGCFTDVDLDLRAPGVHLVVGANEAGKSTTRDALADLLYGFATRTRHAHLHATADLRVGAVLREGGRTLAVVRAKRRPELTTPAGEELGPDALAPFLHGVDRALFTSLFAVGHDELRRGAHQLLGSHGEVGRVLFGAASGRAALVGLLDDLRVHADDAFRPRRGSTRVMAALTRFADADARRAASELPPREWVEATDELAAVERELAAARARRADLEHDRSRLQRIVQVLPAVAALTAAQARRDSLVAEGPWLAVGARARARALRAERVDALRAGAVARSEGERLAVRLAELGADDPVLDHADRIDRVHARAAAHADALQERPDRAARVATRQRLVTERLRSLGVEPDAGELPLIDPSRWRAPAVSGRAELEAAADRGSQLAADLARAEAQRADAADRVAGAEAARAELAAVPDDAILRSALAAVAALGDLPGRRAALAAEAEHLDHEVARTVRRLGLVDHPDPAGLLVPGGDEREAAQAVAVRLAAEADELDERGRDVQRRRVDAERERAALVARAHPPERHELVDAREHRDAGWAIVRRAWSGAPDDGSGAAWASGRELAAAYEAAVHAADRMADRFRDEAEHVGLLAEIDQRLALLDQEQQGLAERVADHDRRCAVAAEAWAGLWERVGVAPVPLTQAAAWASGHDRLVASAERRDDLGRQLAELDRVAEAHRASLVGALTSVGVAVADPGPSVHGGAGGRRVPAPAVDLAALAARAAAEAQLLADRRVAHEERAEHVRTASADLAERTRRVDALAAEHAAWTARWQDLVLVHELPASTSPVAVRAWLDELAAVRRAADDLEEAVTDLQAVDARVRAYETEVASLVALVDGEAGEEPAAAAVARLAKRLRGARDVALARAGLEADRHARAVEADAADAAIARAARELAALLGGDPGSGALDACVEAVVARSDELDQLEATIAAARDDLVAVGGGLGPDELVAEAAGLVADDAHAELARVGDALADLVPALGDLTERRTRLAGVVDRWRGADAAAVAAAEAQEALADVADGAHDFVRLHLAHALLAREIERNRAENEGPVLARAGAHLAALTGDRYGELVVDLTEREPHVEVRRADGVLVGVDGLSEGTRDQLWLALRLAALEAWTDRHGSLPVVLDDAWTTFDDQRTRAALGLLDGLADRVQVLVLTHHDHTVDLARAAVGPGRLTVHRLERFDPVAARAAAAPPGRAGRDRPGVRWDDRILAELLGAEAPLGKADLLARTGAPERAWSRAIGRLVDEGRVAPEGDRRGRRYRPVPA